ncbi:MAG: hypothetical protein OMM_06000 [Candidatus Magnetoglobus multicellularis str. Araruama]|uniref:Uncharacterized protein n=1 Tax=Candidatus Magnetoglobus multicellularis str. Araruama TaxID=890399 RepID=A0A1V1NSV7_9BACT|nr:MAG: hypothetical protein OMM_06000 [Candidatus Magnetoglobus multicellularis str. Araruama]
MSKKITDNISQIHKFLSFKSNTDLSIKNSKSNNLSKFRKNQIYEQSNTPITSIASNNHYFAITRDTGDNTGENELLIGTYEITPGGGHTRLVSKDKILISEITIGLGIIGHTCVCAFEGSKSICGYDLEQIDDLPEEIGIIEEETIVKHSVCILSHNDTLHVVLMINNEKKSLVSFPVDGSSPDPKRICDIDEEFVSTVVVNPDVGISWITQSENSTVLNILNSSFEIITQPINIHNKISALAFDPKTEERICLATADGNIIIMKI